MNAERVCRELVHTRIKATCKTIQVSEVAKPDTPVLQNDAEVKLSEANKRKTNAGDMSLFAVADDNQNFRKRKARVAHIHIVT